MLKACYTLVLDEVLITVPDKNRLLLLEERMTQKQIKT